MLTSFGILFRVVSYGIPKLILVLLRMFWNGIYGILFRRRDERRRVTWRRVVRNLGTRLPSTQLLVSAS
jgi:uncharacterized membrane protein